MAAAFVVSSALGLALLGVIARWLSPEQNAQFLALWGLVFAFGSVLGAVEPEVARQATQATIDGRRVSLGGVQAVAVAAGGAFVVLGALQATHPGRVVTGHSAAIVALVFLAVSGFAVQILTRGLLLGRHALRPYVVVLVGEAVLRLALVGAVVASGTGASLGWATAAIVVGCFSWIPAVGHLVRSVDWTGPRQPWRGVGSTVSALALSSGLAAMVLTGFPAVATMVIGSARELGDLFAVMTFSRVPLVLLAPVQAMMVPAVIRWIRTGQAVQLRRAVRGILVGAVIASTVAAGVGYFLGPWATRVMMGDQYDPARLTCALVLAATCLMGAALLQASVMVALQRYWALTACWSAAVGSAAALLLAPSASAETRGLAGFFAASCVAMVATALTVRRSGHGVGGTTGRERG